MSPVSATSATILPQGTRTGFAALGQGDFIKLMTAQLQQQDPTSPVDNREMLAQLAQFSALGATSESSATLKDISAKLDALIAAQTRAAPPA